MGSGVTRLSIRVPRRRSGDTRGRSGDSRTRSRATVPGVVSVMGGCSSKRFFCRRETVWLDRDGSSWWWYGNGKKMSRTQAGYMLLMCVILVFRQQ